MLFASWTYDGSQLNLMLVDTEGDLSNYIESRYIIVVATIYKHTHTHTTYDLDIEF